MPACTASRGSSASSAGAAASSEPALLDALSKEELEMTVEAYLRAQCEKRIGTLKRHMEGKVEEFEAAAKRTRQELQDISNGINEASAASENAAADETAAADDSKPLSEAFCLVAFKGPHAKTKAGPGLIMKFEPTASKKEWAIGREIDNDLSLPADNEVSSHHAKVTYDAKKEEYKLMDIGSSNGTYIKTDKKTFKAPKKKNHVLKDKHLVTFGGQSTFMWCFASDAQQMADLQIDGSLAD